MQIHTSTSPKGFTLVEMLFGLAMFASIALIVSWILITSLHSNDIIWEQLETQNDGRMVIEQFVNDVRRAEASSIGGYVIEYASSTEFIFYANVDTDGSAKERVRYWIDGTTLKKGVIHVSGEPLDYNGEEQVVSLAESVINIAEGVPLFEYYGEDYPTIDDTPLTLPEYILDVRLVRIQLELEKDPTESPVPLHVEAVTSIRSLKQN